MSEQPKYFPDINQSPTLLQMPGIESTILTGLNKDRMMMVLTRVDPGKAVPEHAHPHEQVGVCYGGKALMNIGGIEKTIERGDFIYVPPDVPHDAKCLGEMPFFMVDIFSPVRNDLLEKLK